MLPPKKAIAFLRWFCREDYIDEIEGDLVELYSKESPASPRLSKWNFTWRVIKYFRPGFIKSFKHYHPNTYSMYRSYVKTGWRYLSRNKGYSAINVIGLAVGMMVATLNGLWIWHEFSHNKYFANYDRIAQVAERGIDLERGGTFVGTTMTYPLATELMDKHDDAFKHIVRTSFHVEKIISAGETRISSRGLYLDANGPEMFSVKMLQGLQSGLKDPHSVLISRTLASALFGGEDPMHRTISLNNQTNVTVTGVFEDFPQNTEFYNLQYFAPWSLFLMENPWIEQRALTDWRNHFIKLYVEIPEGKSFEELTEQVKTALKFDPEDAERRARDKTQLYLYPMHDWHLYPAWRRDGVMEPILMLKLVGAIGAFVLALACINFVNLSTARAEKRAKEIGIRKTIGSVRIQLVNQFFAESFVVVALSFVLCILLTGLLLPGFNEIASKNIEMPFGNLWFWGASLAFVVFTSLLAGFYPALYLSSFNPVKALKGTFRAGRLSSAPRKVLVVFQFSISVVLIIGTAVVYRQIQYAKDRPVGYEREGLIMLPKRTSDYKNKYEVLRNELKNTGAVYEVSESMGPVTDIYSGNNGWAWNGMDPNLDENFATLSVSHLHGKTVGWQFVDGRDFDANLADDSLGIVVNESALKIMKLSHPIGEPVTWTWWADKSRVLHYKILGVIKDMVMESPYAPAEPTIFYLKGHNGNPSWINIKINPAMSAGDALPKIESVFKKVIPTVPFEYQFADEEYARKFGKEERIGNLAAIFAVLAVVISCLGVFGLASFVAETRTKEIGIRKVLGASVTRLWRMLSLDFVWLVVASAFVSAPLAYFLMNRWLEKFAYHTNIPWWIFLATGGGATAITLLTISYQAIKAARMNPVKTLKQE